MENDLIMFSSVTFAMRARDLLTKNRIQNILIRTPAHLRHRSCGYSLFVKNNYKQALELIGSNGIPVLGTAAVDTR